MAHDKLVQSFGGCNRNFNKEKWISACIQQFPWKIQYNEFGLKDEAETIRTELKNFTGLSKTIFPKEIGLPRQNQLKVWYGDQLLWDYGQEQRFPSAQELLTQIGLVEDYSWKIHKKS